MQYAGGIEALGNGRYRLGDLIADEEYKLYVRFGKKQKELRKVSIFRDDQLLQVIIPKDIEDAIEIIDTETKGGKDGKVIKKKPGK